MTGDARATKPKRSIRRFDVFAEYNRQEQEAKGVPERYAKGYGIWVAKIVASQKFGRAPRPEARSRGPEVGKSEAGEPEEPRKREEFRDLDGQPQTDEVFDREIVQRMGREFYDAVFAPAIHRARQAGKSYEGIRDSIRKEWQPERRPR